MGQEFIYYPIIELRDKIQLIQKIDPSYKEKVMDEIIRTNLFFCFLNSQSKEKNNKKDFNEALPNIIYLCEKYEKYLFPQIIFNLVEKTIEKMFNHEESAKNYNYYLEKYKESLNSDLKNKEEIQKTYELFEKIPKEMTNIHKLYLNIFEFCFNILEIFLKNKEVVNEVLDDSHKIGPKQKVEDNKNILKLLKEITAEEKVNIIIALLKSKDIKYTNSIKIIIIQFLLFYLYQEKYDIIKDGNCYEIIKLLNGSQTNKNIDNLMDKAFKKIFLFFYDIKDFSFAEKFFKKNGIEIQLFDKKILEINQKGIENYYYITESKQKNDKICKDLLSGNDLTLEIINFNEIKNKNTISLIQKNIDKEISLKHFISSLNQFSIKIHDYMQLKDKIIIFKEYYDLSLDEFLSSKIKIKIENIRTMFRQLNTILYLLITNNIKSINIHPKNILIKYINKNENIFETKLDSYWICPPYEINDLNQLTPEFIKEEKNVKKSENSEKSELFKIGIIMYSLYAGKNPFGNNLDTIKAKMMKNDEKITLDEKVDKDFKDLVTSLLRFDPIKRIDWNDYFRHKFFQVKIDDKGKLIN